MIEKQEGTWREPLQGLKAKKVSLLLCQQKSAPLGSRFFCIVSAEPTLELDLKMNTLLHAACADLHTRSVRDTSPLKIRVDTAVTTRIKLGSTNRVRILSNDF